MPTMMRAGIVSATFNINSVLTSCVLSPNVSRQTAINGAWLNHTIKLMKNATQVRCRVRVLPLKEKRLNFESNIVAPDATRGLSEQAADSVPNHLFYVSPV